MSAGLSPPPWKENTSITSYSCKYEQMNRLLWTANQQTQTEAGTSKRTAGSKKRGVPVTVSAAPVAAPARTRAGEKSTDRLWASNRKNMISKQGWWNSLNSSSKSNLYDFPAREYKRHHDESFFWVCRAHRCLWSPNNELSSAICYINKELQRECVDCMLSPLPSCPWLRFQPTPAAKQPLPPLGPGMYPGGGVHPLGTVPTQTGISQGMGDWRVPKSPQQCSGPAPSGELPSFIVCYS